MNSLRRLALLALCLLPGAASAEAIPFGTSGMSFFLGSGQDMALLDGGGYAVVWNWTLVGGPNSDSDVRMQWVRPDGSLVFPRAGLAVAATPELQEGQAVVAAHPEAGVFVAFFRGDTEVSTRFVVQRFDGRGKRLWPGAGIVAVPEEGRRIQTLPTLLPDDEGGVYLCFTSLQADGIARTSDILCQHLDANGRRLWTRQGLKAGGVPGLRSAVQGVPDGEGGLLVAWRNDRNVEAAPQARVLIEGQRFSPGGARLWGRQGRLLHRTRVPGRGAIFHRQPLRVASDGQGGALLAFEDRVSDDEPGNFDVVAQRVGRSGQPLWGSGVAVAQGPARQMIEELVPGPGNGAFVLYREDHKDRALLAIHRLAGNGAYFWETRLSAPETYDLSGHGQFDSGLLRIVWARHTASALAQVRLLVLDVLGNRLNGPSGEVLAEPASSAIVDGFLYDRARDQGLALWSFGTSWGKARGVLIEGQD